MTATENPTAARVDVLDVADRLDEVGVAVDGLRAVAAAIAAIRASLGEVPRAPRRLVDLMSVATLEDAHEAERALLVLASAGSELAGRLAWLATDCLDRTTGCRCARCGLPFDQTTVTRPSGRIGDRVLRRCSPRCGGRPAR